MSAFADVLKRLREAAVAQRGRMDTRTVDVRDLRALLFDYDRLDRLVRDSPR